MMLCYLKELARLVPGYPARPARRDSQYPSTLRSLALTHLGALDFECIAPSSSPQAARYSARAVIILIRCSLYAIPFLCLLRCHLLPRGRPEDRLAGLVALRCALTALIGGVVNPSVAVVVNAVRALREYRNGGARRGPVAVERVGSR